jgi:hypothetical protein
LLCPIYRQMHYGMTSMCSQPTAICKLFDQRFLTNEQAAEDSANFMKNIKLDGIQEDLTAPGTPWIYYGVGRLLINVCVILLPDRVFILGLVCRRSCSAHESSLSRYCMGSYCFERYEILARHSKMNILNMYRLRCNTCDFGGLGIHGHHS